MYCDRETANIPKSQSGFITNICLPLFEAWVIYSGSEELNRTCLANIHANLQYWTEKLDIGADGYDFFGNTNLDKTFPFTKTGSFNSHHS
jgi:hypothetical protein